MKGVYIMRMIATALILGLSRLDRTHWNRVTLPPTLRWFNTAGALLLTTNLHNPEYVGGISPENKDRCIHGLDEWWDITDHDSAFETMTELLDGDCSKFARTMQLFSIYRQQMEQKGARTPTTKRNKTSFDIMYEAWEKQGDKAVLAWDLCRVAYITTWCYVCGYLSLDEMLSIGVKAGTQLQQNFSSWEEVMESYLTGYLHWLRSKDNLPSEYKLRVKIYKILQCRKGPFDSIDFFTPLSTKLSEEEKANLKTA